jgi:hypothetical protein
MSAALLLAGAGSASCDRSTSSPVSSPPPSPAPTASMINVFLERTVDDSARVAVEQQLRATPGVRDVAFVTRQEAYERFQELYKDNPDLLNTVKPESLPESFQVTIADGACSEAYDQPLRQVAGVDDVAFSPAGRPEVGVVVQLRDSVTAGQRAAVERAAAAGPRHRAPRFETGAAAAERLRHCGVPGGAGDRPASVRFAYTVPPSPGADRAAVEPLAKLSELEGVLRQYFVPVEAL